MYVKYGNYQHAANECMIAISRQTNRNEAGLAETLTERWQIQGRMQADTVSALTTALTALENAYIDGSDIGLYNDDGTATVHLMRNSLAVGGVRVVEPVSYPEGNKAEYSTFRNYQIAVEGTFLSSIYTGTLSWIEVLDFQGTSGPDWGFLELLNGPPQPQIFRQQTVMTVTQSGEAVGAREYPFPPAPLWPQFEHGPSRAIRRHLPQWSGQGSNRAYTHYRIAWSYKFLVPYHVSATPGPPG